jgi:hypothetical protein
MRREVTMLVDRAAQPETPSQMASRVELLTIGAHAESSEIEVALRPDAHDGAVEDQALPGQRAAVPGVPVALHLAPGSAHCVCRPSHRTRPERTTRPSGDSCSRSARRRTRPPLIGPQRLTLPRRCLALSAVPAAPQYRSARTSPSETAFGYRGGP